MRPVFSEKGWKQFAEWYSDRKIMKKICSLIDDIIENGPTHGIGKPEELKHYDLTTYSRRIDEKNRLVYRYDEEAGLLSIITCRGHYDDEP
jgi:toxin YoeB